MRVRSGSAGASQYQQQAVAVGQDFDSVREPVRHLCLPGLTCADMQDCYNLHAQSAVFIATTKLWGR